MRTHVIAFVGSRCCSMEATISFNNKNYTNMLENVSDSGFVHVCLVYNDTFAARETWKFVKRSSKNGMAWKCFLFSNASLLNNTNYVDSQLWLIFFLLCSFLPYFVCSLFVRLVWLFSVLLYELKTNGKSFYFANFSFYILFVIFQNKFCVRFPWTLYKWRVRYEENVLKWFYKVVQILIW